MWDGSQWSEDTQFPADVVRENMLFKVWGRSPQDVWVVGEFGTAVHYDGTVWLGVDTGISSTRLVTAHGDDDFGPVVVGGLNAPVILRWNGSEFVDDSDTLGDGLMGLNGVFVQGGQASAVGMMGVYFDTDLAASNVEWSMQRPGDLGLHAVTRDGDDTWTVGGDLFALTDGVLLHHGSEPPPEL